MLKSGENRYICVEHAQEENTTYSCYLKVHFVIHSLIPIFSKKVEILILVEAIRYLMFVLKIFLVIYLFDEIITKFVYFHVDIEIPT